ncbi:hypothetical protein A1Q1_06558 [Trichosporon asahii var. asahii CBS 2479]|uniref:NADP-dependent oxidoreductase domain-containing protein n=1 Tax=Trichosporon asahii var. asahii (strain ATCC 90039 / CBS 2479 / JCM 2466 / KCTC 7840 / NBRC 103889/ NCYC 2677 / UAMH 7654) TaxID=1186058 RepID=J5SD68_TRIAS|nr:hypothetical protein A1Q1_06558 [Trichosporon asahii var. asahii CBS 2479]EJT45066.1 hypothetical protein A1Q1_06558 [Trichosporon asahii var. asahii CBS 2479]
MMSLPETASLPLETSPQDVEMRDDASEVGDSLPVPSEDVEMIPQFLRGGELFIAEHPNNRQRSSSRLPRIVPARVPEAALRVTEGGRRGATRQAAQRPSGAGHRVDPAEPQDWKTVRFPDDPKTENAGPPALEAMGAVPGHPDEWDGHDAAQVDAQPTLIPPAERIASVTARAGLERVLVVEKDAILGTLCGDALLSHPQMRSTLLLTVASTHVTELTAGQRLPRPRNAAAPATGGGPVAHCAHLCTRRRGPTRTQYPQRVQVRFEEQPAQRGLCWSRARRSGGVAGCQAQRASRVCSQQISGADPRSNSLIPLTDNDTQRPLTQSRSGVEARALTYADVQSQGRDRGTVRCADQRPEPDPRGRLPCFRPKARRVHPRTHVADMQSVPHIRQSAGGGKVADPRDPGRGTPSGPPHADSCRADMTRYWNTRTRVGGKSLSRWAAGPLAECADAGPVALRVIAHDLSTLFVPTRVYTLYTPLKLTQKQTTSSARRSPLSVKYRKKNQNIMSQKQQKRMPYVRLGNTGLKVSKIILYSNGESERILGKALKELNVPREAYVVLTKVFFPVLGKGEGGTVGAGDLNSIELVNAHGLSRKHIFDSIKASLERLQLDYVDVLQCHRFDYDTPIEETMHALHDVVKAGYCRYIGMSSCHAYQFHQMQNYAKTHNLTPFISMQNFHNAAYREEEREMVPTLRIFGTGMIPWSPLCRGYLTRPWKQAEDTARGKTDVNYRARNLHKPDESRQKINERIEEVAKKKGISMAQCALAWSLANDFVTAPIVGSTRKESLDELIVHVKLTEEEKKYIDEPYTPRAIWLRGWSHVRSQLGKRASAQAPLHTPVLLKQLAHFLEAEARGLGIDAVQNHPPERTHARADRKRDRAPEPVQDWEEGRRHEQIRDPLGLLPWDVAQAAGVGCHEAEHGGEH